LQENTFQNNALEDISQPSNHNSRNFRFESRPRHRLGRAIAQAVSRWLPTAAAQVQTRGQSCGICGGQCVAGAGFLRVLRFPLPIFIPPVSPQSPSPIIRGWCHRPVVAAAPKVPSRELKKKAPIIPEIFVVFPSLSGEFRDSISNNDTVASVPTLQFFIH
jgi:hypothetical protein